MGKVLFPQYFPSCPTNGSEYIIIGYTDALTAGIADTMKMFWRPRKIRVSGTYTQFIDPPRECVLPANFELIIQSAYGSEEEMVCEPYRPWTLASSTNITDPSLSFGWDSKPYYVSSQDSLFSFNAFDFQLDGGESDRRCNLGVLIKQWYAVEGNGGPYTYQTINICGVNFNMATYIDEFGIGFIQPSIEVIEWWSFGGTYDTTTGEPL
jgi:hypothetical protein